MAGGRAASISLPPLSLVLPPASAPKKRRQTPQPAAPAPAINRRPPYFKDKNTPPTAYLGTALDKPQKARVGYDAMTRNTVLRLATPKPLTYDAARTPACPSVNDGSRWQVVQKPPCPKRASLGFSN
ncbi:hypothetical protein BKA80DRAFT_299119 [Phyllosticta citrichinensis]